MGIFDRTANLEGGTAKYEWHGKPNAETIPTVDLDEAPTCTNCSALMEPVEGGFYCSACETAAI